MPAVTVDQSWPVDCVRLLGYASLALGFLGAILKGLYTFYYYYYYFVALIPSSRLSYHNNLISSSVCISRSREGHLAVKLVARIMKGLLTLNVPRTISMMQQIIVSILALNKMTLTCKCYKN